MKLKLKALPGMAGPFSQVDRMLCSQGFRRLRAMPSPKYGMTIRDMASGREYRLTVSASATRTVAHGTCLRLEIPRLKARDKAKFIPEPVIQAACEKMEEVASYLKARSDT